MSKERVAKLEMALKAIVITLESCSYNSKVLISIAEEALIKEESNEN